MLAEVDNVFDPSKFYDVLAWNVTLEAPANSYNVKLLQNSILQGCYNPPSAPNSMNAGMNAIRRLNETDAFAWETALGQRDSAGLSIIRTP